MWTASEQITSFNARASGEYVERKGSVCELWNKEKSGSLSDVAVSRGEDVVCFSPTLIAPLETKTLSYLT